MKKPNFLVIGAAKSGTISLYYYLKQHPQIYMCPVLEPKFFAFKEGEKPHFNGPGDIKANCHIVTDLESYYKLFEGVGNELAIGECSPLYLYNKKTPERIKKIIPTVKIIAILRHPVERAYSNYLHLFSAGREPLLSFKKALEAEEYRINDGWEYFWHYKRQGFYYKYLQGYFNIFDREQIKIYLYEDYQRDAISILQDIFSFLGVDSSFLPNTTKKYNVTKIPKYFTLHKLITQPSIFRSLFITLLPSPLRTKIISTIIPSYHNQTKPHLTPRLKKYLQSEYLKDIVNLQDLIQRDLSHWLAN